MRSHLLRVIYAHIIQSGLSVKRISICHSAMAGHAMRRCSAVHPPPFILSDSNNLKLLHSANQLFLSAPLPMPPPLLQSDTPSNKTRSSFIPSCLPTYTVSIANSCSYEYSESPCSCLRTCFSPLYNITYTLKPNSATQNRPYVKLLLSSTGSISAHTSHISSSF